MILVDANLLFYAIDSDSPHRRAARRWLEQSLSGTTFLGLSWVVILAFLRITTRGDVVRNPLSAEQALAYVDSWLRQPFVRAVSPIEGHWPLLRSLMASSGVAGNQTSDAHVAALALEHGCAVCSTDHDFKRFPGIEHVNPLA